MSDWRDDWPEYDDHTIYLLPIVPEEVLYEYTVLDAAGIPCEIRSNIYGDEQYVEYDPCYDGQAKSAMIAAIREDNLPADEGYDDE